MPDFTMQDGYVVTVTEEFLMEAHAARAPRTNAPLVLGSNVRHYNYAVPHDMPDGYQVEIVDLGEPKDCRLGVDFGTRLIKWHENKLKYQLTRMSGGFDVSPVKARRLEAAPPFRLEDGYHRYIASVIMGFPTIPCMVPKPRAATVSTGRKYVPPHLRNRQ